MTELDGDIITLYDSGEMTVADLEREFSYELEPAAIKAILAQGSKKYRDEYKRQNSAPAPAPGPATSVALSTELNVNELLTPDEHKEILQSIKGVALYGENEAARVRAGIYLHEELTGRNKAKVSKASSSPMQQINIGVLQLNEQLRKLKGDILDVEAAK